MAATVVEWTGKLALIQLKRFASVRGNLPKFPTLMCEVIKKDLDKLEELTKMPTLEEVKKEWEELGYRWRELITHIHIIKYDRCITINLMCNEYECHDRTSLGSCCSTSITFQEHQLLTKTFKALGVVK